MMKVVCFLTTMLWSGAAFAQACGTVDLIAELGSEDRARLDALVAPHPFPEGNLWVAEKDGLSVLVALVASAGGSEQPHDLEVDAVDFDRSADRILVLVEE